MCIRDSAISYATIDVNWTINAAWTDVARAAENAHVPNTLLLPTTFWAKVSNTRMAVGTDTTVLSFFRLNNVYTAVTGQPIDVRAVLWLNDAGENGVPRVVAYEKNADNLTLRNPIPWRALPPQATALRLDIPCEYKISGVSFRYPLSAAYFDLTATA